jgi:uncharacterized membrane protein
MSSQQEQLDKAVKENDRKMEMLAEQEEAHVTERAQWVALEQDIQKEMQVVKVTLAETEGHLTDKKEQASVVQQECVHLQVCRPSSSQNSTTSI